MEYGVWFFPYAVPAESLSHLQEFLPPRHQDAKGHQEKINLCIPSCLRAFVVTNLAQSPLLVA